MISNEVVEATQRAPESRGKNEAVRIRRSGKIPAVIYGAGKDPIAVTLDPRQIKKILNSESGPNTIFDLKIAAGQEKAMNGAWQNDPLKSCLSHIYFKG